MRTEPMSSKKRRSIEEEGESLLRRGALVRVHRRAPWRRVVGRTSTVPAKMSLRPPFSLSTHQNHATSRRRRRSAPNSVIEAPPAWKVGRAVDSRAPRRYRGRDVHLIETAARLLWLEVTLVGADCTVLTQFDPEGQPCDTTGRRAIQCLSGYSCGSGQRCTKGQSPTPARATTAANDAWCSRPVIQGTYRGDST